MIKKLWNLISKPISNWKKEKEFNKRVKELQKRDPFIYK
jgi:hypothetical protein